MVQRSSLSYGGFTDMGFLNAVAGQTQYLFTDNKLDEGTNYYRLKMVDKQGAFTLSQIVRLVSALNNASFQLRPSITSASTTNLVLSLKTKERLTISMNNAAGQLLWTKFLEAQEGIKVQPLDLSSLSKGVYFLHISGSGQQLQVLSLVKQ
ncbi:MAG: hypothetical protein JWR72_2967 [Flavisolibacter sp.]|nr:hypothetical protein [Flavisolibacter sp.]